MFRAAVAALALPALLAGCSSDEGGDGISVVTSIYPLTFVAERVGGDHVDVTQLTEPGQEPHDLELGVQQTAELTDADLLVYGAGFQPAVDEAAENNAEGVVVEALGTIAENPPAIGGARPARVIEDDPHFWLDPRALATVAREVEAQLAELDPEHADDYHANATELFTELVELDGRSSTGLDDCDRRTVVVSHDAFGYYGYRYDLDFEPIAGLSPQAEPSLAHLAELQGLIRDKGVTTVFSETLASPEMAETLAADLGLETAVLDPVEGLSDETADEDYLSLMRANLEALREANGCR
ncbi:MAG TPA: metal ABC transporter substrate-binding protein [Marmoricola sp.]|nr:metal ABC transporter substrate-binding protein [Marmoricola sp.]